MVFKTSCFVSDCGHYRITCDSIENYQDFILTELTFTDTRYIHMFFKEPRCSMNHYVRPSVTSHLTLYTRLICFHMLYLKGRLYILKYLVNISALYSHL